MQKKIPLFLTGAIVRVMKLSAIIVTIICSTVATLHASYSNAQAALDKKISIQLKNTSLQDALERIGSVANVSFSYAGNQTLANNTVNVNAKNQKVGDLLNTLLEPFPLSYVVVEERIVVRYDATKKTKKEDAAVAANKEVFQAFAKTPPPFVVTGKVVNEKKAPLSGASATIKSTNKGAVTNDRGEFEIRDVNPGEILVITMTGYREQDIKLNGDRKYILVQLVEDSSSLQDVVVTGFNTVSKKKFTGSSVKLKADDVKMDGIIDVSRMLEGRAAGVSVQNVSGTFGSAPKIRIRGATSINGENKPLWVVDGVVLEDLVNISNDQLSSGDPTTLLGSSVAGINSNDIETFDILKDAAATALYGARAMNGVVVITTKKGRAGKSSVNYTGNFSTQLKPVYSNYDIMNSAQQMSVWGELERKGVLSTSILSQGDYGVYGKMYQLMDADANGNFGLQNTTAAKNAFLMRYAKANTNWFGILFRNSLMQEHSLSISSGTDKSQSFFSTSFYDDNGWTIADKVKRYTLNFHNNYNLSNRLTAGFITTGSYRQQNAPGTLSRTSNPVTGTFERDFDLNPFSYSLNTSRALTAYDENGNREYFRRNFAPFNILTELENNRLKINVIDLKLQGELGYKFSKSLKFDFIGSMRYVRSTTEHEITENANMANAYRANGTSTIAENNKFLYRDPDNPESLPVVVLPYGGFYNRVENQLLSFDIRNTLSYSKTFNGKHAVTGLVGQQVRLADRQNFSNTGYGYQYDNGGVPFIDPNILKQTIQSGFPYYDMTKTYDRFVGFYGNVDYMYDRRYSISVVGRFDGSNQLGSSQTARWLPTGTVSAAWNVDEESFMKNIDAVDYLKVRASYGLTASLGPATNSNVVLKNATSNRAYSTERESVIQLLYLENSNLTWEKNHQLNFGVDAGFFKNRLTATIEPWFRKSFDLIGPFKTSGIGGESIKLANYADMKSHGVDVQVSGVIVKQKDWGWRSTASFGYNTTKITNIKNDPLIFDLVKSEGGNLEGYPVNGLFSIDYVKLIRNNGTPIFKDENNQDNAAVYLQATGADSFLVYQGQVDPKITGGFNNTFNYKQFTLNIFFTFQAGNMIRLYPAFKNGYTDYDAMPKEFFDRWSLIGDAAVPGTQPAIVDRVTAAQLAGTYAYNNYNYSTARVAKGDFIRLKTVSLSYNMKQSALDKIGFKSLSFTLATTNPWLIYADKKLEGQDPEFFNSGGVAQPLQKQITLSLKAGL